MLASYRQHIKTNLSYCMMWGLLILPCISSGMGAATATPPADAPESPAATYAFATTGTITATQIGDGVWWTPELDETSITQVLDDLNRWDVPNLYLDLFRDGHTLFPSSVFPQRAGAQDRDWLDYIVTMAHEKNIRVHGWMQVLHWNDEKSSDGTTHPLLEQNPQWIDLPRRSQEARKPSSVYVNPGLPEVRTALTTMVLEACKYPLDGINLDSMKYNPDVQSGYNALMTQEFRLSVGSDPMNFAVDTRDNSPWMQWVAFREDKLTSLVEILHDTVTSQRGEYERRILLSATVEPGYEENRGKSRTFQHWGQWLDHKLIDITMPQCFNAELPDLEHQLWQARTLHMGSKIACIPGLALSLEPNGQHPSLKEQKRLLRNVGFQHCTVLNYESLRAAKNDPANQDEEDNDSMWHFFTNR